MTHVEGKAISLDDTRYHRNSRLLSLEVTDQSPNVLVLPHDRASLLLGIYPRELKTCPQTCTRMECS